jgi:hypothetical protein
MMKHLQPKLFIENLDDSNDPLCGILFGLILLSVVIVGLRLRLTRGDIGDAGIIILNVYIGLEWGGGERSEKWQP